MRSLNICLISLLLSLVCTQAFAQTKKDSVRLKLTIAKASDNDFTKGKPAEVIGTFPSADTVDNSWLTNAFIEASLSTALSRWSFGLTAELHRNTLIEKEQYVRQFGISIGKVFVLSRTAIGAAKTELPITFNARYSEDKIEETEELQAILGLSIDKLTGPQILKTKSLFPAYGGGLPKALMFSHDHNVGMAYLGEDEVLLGQFDFEFNVFLLPVLSDKWVERYDLFKAQVTYNGRTEFIGSTDRDLHSQLNFQLGLNLPFGSEDQNSVGIAHDWISGADPLKGLENQKYRTFTVKAKIVIN